jgi:hypothetical protein
VFDDLERIGLNPALELCYRYILYSIYRSTHIPLFLYMECPFAFEALNWFRGTHPHVEVRAFPSNI